MKGSSGLEYMSDESERENELWGCTSRSVSCLSV